MHATATVSGKSCDVRITRDLVDNYAVEVLPPPDPRKKPLPNQRAAPLFIYKLKADSWQAAAWAVLAHLKESGKIQGFESEAVPPKAVKKAAGAAEEGAEEGE
ncbi:MAG: hypothetical protein ACYDCL_09495 [Myxococcales bacterium]